MKNLKILLAGIACGVMIASSALADVHVNGYYRKDGTYVAPHIRASPNSSRADNYGPSQNSFERMNPKSRDFDHDGTPNYLDNDDNNNGIHDNQDKRQYGW